MSFLNPVSLPVKRFKSTDAGAPQINYNSRIAGDVKAVLKWGLEAAGWTTINEVGNVCEFVSPSVAMSDYRLGIDDSTATKTDWYYQYQDSRINPPLYSAIVKTPRSINKTSSQNGWQCLVTDRGVAFIEIFLHSVINKISARLTYFALSKSATNSPDSILFFSHGQDGGSTEYPYNMFYDVSGVHTIQSGVYISSAVVGKTGERVTSSDAAVIDALSETYMMVGSDIVASVPALFGIKKAKSSDFFGVHDIDIDDRSFVTLPLSSHFVSTSNAFNRSMGVALRSDFWEH